MKRAPINDAGTFALLLVLWLAFMMVAASPAWADQGHGGSSGSSGSSGSGSGSGDDDDDDDDDDDAPATTTTTTETTMPPTTTILPTTTTSLAPVTATTTSTTRPETPTTTTVVSAPQDDRSEEQRLEDSYGATTSTSSHPKPENDFDSNELLVVSMALADAGSSDGGPIERDDNGLHISPREGLTVAFRTAVEAIEGQLLQSMLLGILIAAFFVAGVDKKRDESKVEAAPLLRSYSTGRQNPGSRTIHRR
jgi:hypothetical protein